jgi:hypothetical protein
MSNLPDFFNNAQGAIITLPEIGGLRPYKTSKQLII